MNESTSYTEYLQDEAYSLSPDDDDYTARLEAVAGYFRTPGELIGAFIAENGFSGKTDDTREKVGFLKDKFKAAGIPAPRNISDWFDKDKTYSRETAYKICFAFHLNREQVDNFFRKVYLDRSFDCHNLDEAIYYYCIGNGSDWEHARRLRDEVGELPEKNTTAAAPAAKAGFEKASVSTAGETQNRERSGDTSVVYTSTIREILSHISSDDELTQYLKNNISQFSYHNVTATENIRSIWSRIAGENGLAWREGILLRKTDPAIRDDEKTFTVDKKVSRWNIFSQIISLKKYDYEKYSKDRSIKKILVSNRVLNSLAEQSFPDREGLDKILSGGNADYERIRKLLILLEFYAYWAEKAVTTGYSKETAGRVRDADKCFSLINKYLIDSGYPELYYGNPYDWIFMWALNSDRPLDEFRYYMGEVLAVASEKN
ncbi:MAG: hypothetical protein ACI4CS_00310 [Candidatus Weimeria sp.]